MNRTNEEVRDEILKRAKEFNQRRAAKKRIVCSCISATVCLAITVTVILYKSGVQNSIDISNRQSTSDNGNSLTEPNSTTEQTPAQTQFSQSEKSASMISIRLFPASKGNPDADSFGEDELPHTDVVLNGSILYKQLPLEEYKQYGLEETLSRSDFGAFVGTVIETSQDDPSVKVGAEDPNLKRSSVYYYAPSNMSALIVQKDNYCSIFVFEQFTDQSNKYGFKEAYSLYGTDSGDGISYLSYTVQGMVGSQYRVIEEGTVTSRSKINSFYKITAALIPFETNDPIAATPDWLVKAQAEYNAHPEKSKREDITVNIHFKNGMILKNILYQPYISTGYVNLMEPLTHEQNAELRAAITGD